MRRWKNLEVKGKTGFRIVDRSVPVLIRDERGVPFYDTRFLENRVYAFNMPAGKYFIESGKITPCEPIEYELTPMPPPERRKPQNPETFKICTGDNPYKCTIDWNARTITFDHSLCDLPLTNLMLILEHEYAHRFYKTEELCDRLAANKLLERGYNPSQIGEAMIGTLSAKQYDRKEAMVNNMLDHFDNVDSCDCDNLEYNDTPTTSWSCEDWVTWHADLLRAFQDGRLGKLDAQKALDETNRVFAYHWNESAGFSKTFWGKCGYNSGFYDYFRKIGYTDHISFIAGIVTPVLSGAANVSGGAGDVVKSTGSALTTIANYLPAILILAVVLIITKK